MSNIKPYNFKNKIVVITGVTGALGQAIVRGFYDYDSIVIACYRGDSAKIKEIKSQYPGDNFIPYKCDICNGDEVYLAIDTIIKNHKGIDILINNAGINELSPFMVMREDTWNLVIDTNLNGVKRMCSAVSKPMMLRHSGCIINISSVLSKVLGRGNAAYAASKAAIERFTQIASQELGKKGIRINAVAPGLLEQGMGKSMNIKAEQIALERIPLGRKGRLDEVVEAILFLASDKAAYITGHTLIIDGGLSYG